MARKELRELALPPLAPGSTFTVDAQSPVGQWQHFLGLPRTPDSDQPIGAALEKARGPVNERDKVLMTDLADSGTMPLWAPTSYAACQHGTEENPHEHE